ncbi:MAG: hypothetical protein VKJ44_06660 [Synechococcus sp.]|nr:hypothetical protein [Synechococcus sp.]
MGWDPAVLRKYNATGHFRLLNQVRGELRDHPLIRPGEGESVATANRSRSLIRAIAARAQAGAGRSRRAAEAVEVRLLDPSTMPPPPTAAASRLGGGADSAAPLRFRDRLSAIDMR